MSIELVPWPPGDVERLERWIAAPHVARWWRAETSDPVLAALHAGSGTGEIRAWRADLDGRPVGYAQDRPVLGDAAWQNEADAGAGTRQVDVLLGEADVLNRKLGREAIRALTARLFAEAGTDRIVAAPHPDNWPAIIAFKRAGFRERGRRQFPGGPAMLLTAARAVWKG